MAGNETSTSSAHFRRYFIIANLLDRAFRVPGTSWRFGFDAIIGLVPGIGDITTAAIGAYGLVVAQQLGAPASIQLRMLWNLFVDAAVGAIPVAGDAFDFAFKANLRNVRLLESWLARPRATHRSSAVMLFAMLSVLIVLIVGSVWLVFAGVRALFHLFAGAA